MAENYDENIMPMADDEETEQFIDRVQLADGKTYFIKTDTSHLEEQVNTLSERHIHYDESIGEIDEAIENAKHQITQVTKDIENIKTGNSTLNFGPYSIVNGGDGIYFILTSEYEGA